MGKGGSSSTSKTTTTTEQYDQRVLAETGSLAIGAGGEFTYTQEFGTEVANAFDSLIEFAEEAGRALMKQSEQSQKAASEQFASQHKTLSEQLAISQAPTETFIRKVLPYSVVAFFGFLAYFILRKK